MRRDFPVVGVTYGGAYVSLALWVMTEKLSRSFAFQERCIRAGTLTVNYEKVDVDYKLKHNDLLANIVHR